MVPRAWGLGLGTWGEARVDAMDRPQHPPRKINLEASEAGSEFYSSNGLLEKPAAQRRATPKPQVPDPKPLFPAFANPHTPHPDAIASEAP